jgi:multidrug resistance efflux pump
MKEMGLQDGPNQEVSRGLEAKMDDLPGLLKQQADHVYQNSAAARAEVSKEAAAMSRTKETNKTLLQGKQMDIDAGRWTKLNRAGSLSFEQQFIKLNAVQQINALRQAAIQAKQEGNEGLAASYEARVQDPILIKSAEALASAGGAATIAQAPGQRPTLATKQSQVDLGTKSPSKADGKTFETRIKLD